MKDFDRHEIHEQIAALQTTLQAYHEYLLNNDEEGWEEWEIDTLRHAKYTAKSLGDMKQMLEFRFEQEANKYK